MNFRLLSCRKAGGMESPFEPRVGQTHGSVPWMAKGLNVRDSVDPCMFS